MNRLKIILLLISVFILTEVISYSSDVQIHSPWKKSGNSISVVDPLANVSIGNTGAAGARLDVHGDDGSTANITLNIHRDPGVGGNIVMLRSRGTMAAPTGVINGTILGSLVFTGYDTAAYASSIFYRATATETWSGTARGAKFSLHLTSNGSVTPFEAVSWDSTGNMGLSQTTPTAVIHIKAGTAAANTAPLKFASGTNLTTPEAGAVEYDGTNLFYTTSTPTRNTLASVLSATSASIGGGALIAGACANTTTAVTGAATTMAVIVTPTTYPGDGNFWHGYVSSANNVTVSICAAIAGTPTASTYIIRVIK